MAARIVKMGAMRGFINISAEALTRTICVSSTVRRWRIPATIKSGVSFSNQHQIRSAWTYCFEVRKGFENTMEIE
jgi:hypothetical protein